jgi:two-component system chemotaxis response regulator CheY
MARIMIVDDTSLMRKVLSEILVVHGHEIVCAAANGREGVEAYSKVKPDVVIMDVSMPEMDGICALKLILEEDPLAKIVMCSTFGQQSFILKAIEMGAKDFIVKPFSSFQVIEVIDHVESRVR